MVAQQTLTLYVRVRILHPLPEPRNFGSEVFSFAFQGIYPLVCPLQHQNALHTGKNTGGTRDKMSLVPPCFYIPRWGRLWILDYRVSTAPFKARCIAVVHDNALSFDLCITNQIRNICVVNREKPNITGCVVYESSVCSIHM